MLSKVAEGFEQDKEDKDKDSKKDSDSDSKKSNKKSDAKSKDSDDDDDDEDETNINRKSLPTFLNKGFKCMKYRPVSTVNPQYCANAEQKCNSKGIVLLGPLKSGFYAVMVADSGNQIVCNTATFGIKDEDMSGKRCFTHKAEEPDTTDDKKNIIPDSFSHRGCIKGDQSNAIVLKQGGNAKCDKDTFDTASGKCKCYKVEFPFDDTLTDFYYPIRFNTEGDFQCISGDGKKCTGLNNEVGCLTVLAAKIEDKNIMKVDEDLKSTIVKFFFNRWIAPKESGLPVCMRFESGDNGKSYNISCLSRGGEDCFYDENAQLACERVNSCEEAKKEFSQLTCASENFKKLWFHNGFNIAVNTWCKRASAWLRFDSGISVTKTSRKIGLILMPNGMTACVPAIMNPNECLVENDQNILNKTIEFYLSNPSNFSKVLTCKGKLIKRAKGNPLHWCASSILTPDEKGQFKSDLEFNLAVASGKNGKSVKVEGSQEQFTKVEVWYEKFAVTTTRWETTKTHMRYIVDVNGDGISDIVGFGDQGVFVSLGNSDNGFEQATLWMNRYGYRNGNWRDENPRFVIDMNKDGKADIVAFNSNCIEIALSNGSSFDEYKCVSKQFTYNETWRSAKHPRHVVDINMDGYPDIVGFHDKGVYISLNIEGKIQAAKLVYENFGTKNGWMIERHPRFIIDINKDGYPDIVGFGGSHIYVGLSQNKGASFKSETWLKNGYAYDKGGWRVDKHPRMLADVNKDGLPDVVGFGHSYVYIAINTGSSFVNKGGRITGFGYGSGYRVPIHNRFFIDMNGDGYPDCVSTANSVVAVALNKKGNGLSYESYTVWTKEFTKNTGWRSDKHPFFLHDLNNNELPDIVALHDSGIYTAMNLGNKFEASKYHWGSFGTGIGNANGWDEQKYHIREFKDMNGDKIPDAVAYVDDGFIVNINKGTTFQGDRYWIHNFSYKNGGWYNNNHPRIIADINNDGLNDIVGFGSARVHLGINKGEKFEVVNSIVHFGYNSGAGGYRTDGHIRVLGDFNKDGFLDIIGMHHTEVRVALNNQNNGFNSQTVWLTDDFCYKEGWRIEKHPRLIVDFNQDGYDDIIGFGSEAVFLSINNGKNGFNKKVNISDEFGYDAGWRVDQHHRYVIDVNGDSLPDVVGFGNDGVYIAISTGTKLNKSEKWTEEFGNSSKNGGWLGTLYKRTVIDVNKDGLPDIVGFYKDGVYVSFNVSGKKFDEAKKWNEFFGNVDDSGDWNNKDHREIMDMNGDGYPDLVGIKNDDIYVSINQLK